MCSKWIRGSDTLSRVLQPKMKDLCIIGWKTCSSITLPELGFLPTKIAFAINRNHEGQESNFIYSWHPVGFLGRCLTSWTSQLWILLRCGWKQIDLNILSTFFMLPKTDRAKSMSHEMIQKKFEDHGSISWKAISQMFKSFKDGCTTHPISWWLLVPSWLGISYQNLAGMESDRY